MGIAESKYRKEAKMMLSQITHARVLFHQHKPSIGYIGEFLLRKSLKRILPHEFDICQGFILNNDKGKGVLSKQCDITIFRKGEGAIAYSIGDLKVINARLAIAVIEVKSSVSKKTFFTTLDLFKGLEGFGIRHCFLFVYNTITRNSLNSWFYQYRLPQNNNSEWMVLDTPLYDWQDKEWLPKSIISVASCKYYMLGHLQNENDDWLGYAAYRITDRENEEISSVQEFFATITDILNDAFELEYDAYSVKDGLLLFRM